MPSTEPPGVADVDESSGDGRDIQGTIHVAYHIENDTLREVRNRLRAFFRRESSTADEPTERPISWGPETERWVENDPGRRIDHFETALDGWKNDDQKPILESAITQLHAEIQEGDLLPFDHLVFEFGLSLSEDESQLNAPRRLVFITQKCRDLASWILGQGHFGDGQIIAATTRQVPKEDLESLRESLRRLQDAEGDEFDKLLESHPLLKKPPVGIRSESAGFSHYAIALNLHAVVGRLSSSWIRGPGWAVTVYEAPMGTGSTTWGATGSGLIDPLQRRRETAYVEGRITGLPMLLVLWNWIAKKNDTVRDYYRRLAALDRRLRPPLLWPSTLFAVRPIHVLTSDTRSLVHKLRTIQDEYNHSLTAFRDEIEQNWSRETWIPPESQRQLSPEERSRMGILYRSVDYVLRDLDLLSTAASDSWEMAKSQQKDYSTRIQRAVAIAVLFFAIVEAGPLLLDWFNPIF